MSDWLGRDTSEMIMKKGDWIFDGCDQIGKAASDPYEICGQFHVDVTLYNRAGDRVGRLSPPMGGPRHFEPACSAADWMVIEKPRFPLPWYRELSSVVRPALAA